MSWNRDFRLLNLLKQMEYLNDLTVKIEGAGLTWPGIVCAVCILAGAVIGYARGLVKELVSLAIVFVSIALVWFLNPYVNRFLREVTPLESKVADRTKEAIAEELGGGQTIRADEQTEIIEDLDLPQTLTKALLRNNNAEGYRKLNVSSFVDYVSEYIASVILNGGSFLITFLIVTILLRILVFVLDIFSRLPVLHGLNKLGGAALGGARYVFVIWVLMLAATVLCNTRIGRTAMEYIEHDRFLQFLYSWNMLLRYFVGV